MNILTWNVRGINNPSKDITIRKTVISNHIDVLRLTEIKLHEVSRVKVASLWSNSNFDYICENATPIHGEFYY